MTIEMSIWERYEDVVQGIPVERTADFAWMLENPDEFDWRLILRRFEPRNELLDRICRFEFDPPQRYSEETVVDLGNSLALDYERAASLYGAKYFQWARESSPLQVQLVESESPPPSVDEVPEIHECLNDAYRPEIFSVAGAPALKTVLEARVQSLGLYYLLGPLLSNEPGFRAVLELEKMRVGHWVVDGKLCLQAPLPDPWADEDDRSNWDPQLDWPTDDEVERWASLRRAR